MERRNFLKNSLLTGAGFASVAQSFASATHSPSSSINDLANNNKLFNLDYAFHDGMFRQHGGESFTDQIKWAHEQGFRSIEDNGMMARTPEQQKKIGETLAKLGMRMGVFVITTDNWHWKTTLTTGKQEWIDKMIKDCKDAVEVAKRVNAKWMTVVPGNYDRSLSHEMQTANVITALRKGSEILDKHNLVMVLEPLSDNPDLFLRHSHQTYMICKAVNSPACKILYDAYHMQRNEGDIIANMDRCWEEIAYLQVGDNPGRKEPTTGEMNYKNIFKHIYNKGFKGIVGMEHGNAQPGKEGEMALINAYREVDGFK